jgi:hypothetical protein
MAELIPGPAVVPAVGTRPKRIEEYVGRVNTPDESRRSGASVSIARMQSPSGWVEPGQVPEFDEYTVVLRGSLRVESRRADGTTTVLDVAAGQAVIARRGEWVRYSTPRADGAEYVAVCLPAFSPDTVHRDP